MPNRNEGMMVRGRPTRRARLAEASIELPEQPVRASFFAVQEEAGGTAPGDMAPARIATVRLAV